MDTLNELRGTFELHNTVALVNQTDISTFTELCNTNKIKPIHVLILYNEDYMSSDHFEKLGVQENTNKLLFKGYKPVVLYQTSKYFVGLLKDAFNELRKITGLLQENSYHVVREKIEAVRSTIDLNKLKGHNECYHETHIVVDCDKYTDTNIHLLDKLNKIVNQLNLSLNNLYIPLSFNLKKYEENQVFITLRNYLSDLEELDINDIILQSKTQIEEKFKIIKTINETVVFDSNYYVDCQKF